MKIRRNKSLYIIIFISIVLSICIWNISFFFIPSIIIVSSLLLINFEKKSKISINLFQIGFISLFVYEIINCFFSSYPPNSVISLIELTSVLSCLIITKKLMEREKYKMYLILFISIIALFYTLINIPLFYLKFYESSVYGFEDFSQFRFLYTPMYLLSNEWVTILFCFLPFPIMGLILNLEQKTMKEPYCFFYSRIVKYIFFITVVLITFNIFISFSRAGFLAFLLFVVLFNILVYFNNILSRGKLLLLNIAVICILGLFFLSYSSSIHSTLLQPSTSHQRSATGRISQWEQSIEIFREHPFIGIGSRNYTLISSKWQNMKEDSSFTGRVNNSYIQLLIEKGILGFLLWSFLILLFFYYSTKKKLQKDKIVNIVTLSGVIAILIREMFFSSIFHNGGILFLFLLLILINDFKPVLIIQTNIKKLCVYPLLIAISITSIYYYVIHHFEIKKYEDYINSGIESKNIFENKNNKEKETKNPLMYAAIGLRYERNIPIIPNFENISEIDKDEELYDKINEAIKCYQEVIKLNPYDDLYFHNLGWLYFFNNQKQEALCNILKSIALAPNIALYHVSRGLMLEADSLSLAFDEYMIAIVLSPDICDSQFYSDLRKRQPKYAEALLTKSYDELQRMQYKRYSSILEARMGKILLAQGKLDEAHLILSKVTKLHPNLSRSWYNLGVIEARIGNYKKMQDSFRKSAYLNPIDHLPVYGLSVYYEINKDTISANIYRKLAQHKWNVKKSTHSERSMRIYYRIVDNDDVIPKNLLDYISPNCILIKYDKD